VLTPFTLVVLLSAVRLRTDLEAGRDDVVVDEDSTEGGHETLDEEGRGEAVRELGVSPGQEDGQYDGHAHHGEDGDVVVQAPGQAAQLVLLGADGEDCEDLGREEHERSGDCRAQNNPGRDELGGDAVLAGVGPDAEGGGEVAGDGGQDALDDHHDDESGEVPAPEKSELVHHAEAEGEGNGENQHAEGKPLENIAECQDDDHRGPRYFHQQPGHHEDGRVLDCFLEDR